MGPDFGRDMGRALMVFVVTVGIATFAVGLGLGFLLKWLFD